MLVQGDAPGVVVHEWIARSGGSEKVLEVLMDLFPTSDVLCLWNDSDAFAATGRVRETWLSRTPLRKSKIGSLPIMPLVWSRLSGRYEWAVISSHLFAHHATFPHSPGTKKFVYVHTPARYIWTPELDARGANIPARAAARLFKPLDRAKAREIHSIAANSHFVRQRVERFWHRESTVIHPPVDAARIAANSDWASALTAVEQEQVAQLPETFLLGASRAIPYKKLDRVIEIAHATALPLVVAGDGPELPRLRELARDLRARVSFVGRCSDEMLYYLYGRAHAFVFPPIEDFGIMPVEAMAAGAPVIANRVGGAAESVVDAETGFLVDFRSDEDLKWAVAAIHPDMKRRARARSMEFDRARFSARVHEWVGGQSGENQW